MEFDEVKSFFNEEGICTNFQLLKRNIFKCGLDDNGRAFIYPYLLGVKDPNISFEANNQILKNKLQQYTTMKSQWQSFLPDQVKNVPAIADLLRVVCGDVKRTDRFTPQYGPDDSLYSKVLHDVLVTYDLYNNDTSYVQGIGDLISPIIIIIIKDWKDDETAILYDGTTTSRIEIESYIFWILTGILHTLKHDRIFMNLLENQKFVLKRIFKFASLVDPPVQRLFQHTEMEDLLFMFRPYLLLFKRDFPVPNLLRIWDSFFSAELISVFPRIFASALIILLFPLYLTAEDFSIGEIMRITDSAISSIDPETALNLSVAIQEEMLSMVDNQWIFDDMPDNDQYIEWEPKFLKLL
ncbi:TBC domain containing protein [Histomonas meleagridis]|uniref:TBC domain containing protein n=1 Tax=Histomonas meleagridis TaxID=135588 RepID=UPI00355AB667|nr:TBC domain containing protein [Histomonas meleagridis]KAH0798125.1 TBC domain containing protein [Histomonas meleagridis]